MDMVPLGSYSTRTCRTPVRQPVNSNLGFLSGFTGLLYQPWFVGMRPAGLGVVHWTRGRRLPLYPKLLGPSWDSVRYSLGQMALEARVFKTETTSVKSRLSSIFTFSAIFERVPLLW